ncbi:hypothetical protein NP590_15585 [Methylomonas sp. SURF-2]|uniref:Uncharacterized protein n=1 Tax=Methylomonas subterranea TaxID=2952225 RepID=A0ABT1TJ95_9GAMM|nr:hypothetical protein [Methylomonas sp. SURF-2]MCQ8105533.1 hypothetical protein [Methylomonas sp. SURF-2]
MSSIKPIKKYPVPNVVYVDVDGTLLINNRVNHPLVAWVRDQHSEGKQIVVWSARGVGAAIMAVDVCGIRDIVSHTLSKPGYVVDDLGKRFTQYMEIIHVNEIDGRKNSIIHKRKIR